jgi:hypothetical protein
MSELLSNLNTADEVPKKGDVLVIRTKKSGDKKIMVMVKDVIKSDGDFEIILNKSTNSYFIWSMFYRGESWVWRVWNLGNVTMTASTNNTNSLIDL